MFLKSPSKVLLLAAFSLVVLIASQAYADHDPNNPHRDHGCRVHSDCGPGAGFECNPTTGECTCPGPPLKNYVIIPAAKPQCQKIAALEESCNYNDQCFTHGGQLSRCYKDKCECYDTKNDGREVIRPYRGTCYTATALDVDCDTDNQCKAFIEPEDHVKCFHNSTVGKSVCRCIDGQHCKEKSGAQAVTFGITSMVTFAVLGLMATQILL